jgi:phenylacetic acid degradation operon negative regulatory protein
MKTNQVILDLLRTYGPNGTTVQDITETGSLFGISENTIRVNLSRLVAKSLIELMERGRYRLCANTSAVHDFAESWRLGEQRMTPWTDNRWLGVHLPRANERSKWVLTNYGYREISTGLWIRPSNLNAPAEELRQRQVSLGLDVAAVCLEGARLVGSETERWIQHFDLAALETRYVDMTSRLQSSLKRLASLPRHSAKRESFELGGEAIEIMAKDPLIPQQYMPSHARKRLWQVLLDYDQAGRQVWASATQMPDTLVTPNSQLMTS